MKHWPLRNFSPISEAEIFEMLKLSFRAEVNDMNQRLYQCSCESACAVVIFSDI